MRHLLLIICLVWSCLAQAKDVLILHSYHQGYYWTDEFQSGLSETLKAHAVPHRAVYLDTKRFQSPGYLEMLYQLYRTKLSEESFAAIVASDNNALYLLQRLSQYLGDTPVIFSGINGYTPEMHSNLNATGISSRIEIEKNISLIKQLQPNVSQIYMISDRSVTGAAVRSTVNEYLRQNPALKPLLKQVVPQSAAELMEFVSTVPADSAILFWGYNTEEERLNHALRIRESIHEQASAPVYIFHDSGFGQGVVGGYMHSGVSQGQSVGNLLLELLDNPEQPLPPVRNATPVLKLDYQALKRWQLSPLEESQLYNAPQSIDEQVAENLKLVIGALGLSLAVVLSLLYYVRKIRQSEQRARQSQMLLESIFDQSHQYIGILDQYGCLVSSNNKLHELLFDQGLHLERPIWHNRGWEQISAEQIADYFSQPRSESARFEAEVFAREAGSLMLDVVINPLPADAGKGQQYLFEGSDITQGKLAEQKLVERESNMRIYYEQQPVMMMTLDDRDRVQAVNRFAEELLGYQELQVLGHRLGEFYCDDSLMSVRQYLLQPKQALRDVWRREVRYRHKDGSTLWIRENIRPLDETGQLLVVGEDITEIHSLTEQLEYQARYDSLTEAFNRNHFEAELEASLTEVRNQLRTHAMMYIDLDQLKVLNDTAGHEAGDAAIKFSATIIEQVLPYNAVLARMGGDEFAVLLRDSTEQDTKKIARALINALAQNPFKWDDIVLNITCSIGIRLIDDTAESTQMVHAQADTACHAAKEEGRNRYHLYHVDDEDLRRRHLEMESVNLVHDALAKNRIELFAQRILDLDESNGEQMYFEILVRIRDNNGDYISPGIFMPASEKYNVAHLIDKAVLTQTLAWLEANPHALERLGTCAINLSGQSMGNREFIDFLLDTVQNSRVPGDKLCFEITETAAMGNLDLAVKLFTKIRQLGCRIALDDFGSGLSSFGYLKKLPVDTVKIDGLFVRDMDQNETDYIMVRSINDLAKQMGKKTVAEFVESSAILEKLLELGVDYAQGYVVARPKPLAELVDELLGEASQSSAVS